MGNITGYNESQVRRSLESLQGAYNDLYYVLSKRMQSEFIDKTATGWGSPNAQTFFNRVVTTMNDLLKKVTSDFATVSASIITAANKWANSTGSVFSAQSLSAQTTTVNSQSVKNNLNGVAGASNSVLNDSKVALGSINSGVDSALDKAVNAVRSAGFSDDESSQQEALTRTLQSLKSKLDTNISSIKNELEKEINKTIADMARVVSQNASDLGSMK